MSGPKTPYHFGVFRCPPIMRQLELLPDRWTFRFMRTPVSPTHVNTRSPKPHRAVCLHEMGVLMACLKANEFEDWRCAQEQAEVRRCAQEANAALRAYKAEKRAIQAQAEREQTQANKQRGDPRKQVRDHRTPAHVLERQAQAQAPPAGPIRLHQLRNQQINAMLRQYPLHMQKGRVHVYDPQHTLASSSPSPSHSPVSAGAGAAGGAGSTGGGTWRTTQAAAREQRQVWKALRSGTP